MLDGADGRGAIDDAGEPAAEKMAKVVEVGLEDDFRRFRAREGHGLGRQRRGIFHGGKGRSESPG
jgi:hypothetical protein